MKVLIFISGTETNQGLDSPMSGEGVWAASLTKMLSLYGHDVTAVAGVPWKIPSWGNARRYSNVNLTHIWDPRIEYDLVLYTPWENLNVGHRGNYGACTTLPIKAKAFVHCQFGFGASVETDHTCYHNKHYICYPYIQDAAQWPTTGNFKYFPLPIPVYETLTDINPATRKNIIWSSKAVFHKDWPDDHYILKLGENALKALLKLKKEYNFHLYFLDGKYLDTPHAMKAKAPNMIGELKDCTVYHSIIERHKLMELMGTCRSAIVLGGMLGSFAENIASGAVPLCFPEHIYRGSANELGLILDHYTTTEDNIYNNLKRQFESDEFYLKTIGMYRYELRHHSYARVYEYFQDMCKSIGL